VDIEDANKTEREQLVAAAVDKLARHKPPEWLDERQVAARYPFSLRGLQLARREGTGPPFHRIQGKHNQRSRVFYHTADIETFLAQSRIEPHRES